MRLVLAICGYSGAGKTTLIEGLLPLLAARGLRVGVLKHDTHHLTLDPQGKDTARFYDAGAAVVCAHDPRQHFVRTREGGPVPLSSVLASLPWDLDLVLVEGHKSSPLPKIVLEHPDPKPAIVGPDVLATLPRGSDRPIRAAELISSWLEQAWARRPLGVALFVGKVASDATAASLRAAIERLAALADRLLLVGGNIELVRRGLWLGLPDLPEVEGPLSGLLGLLRYDPGHAWVAVAADQPHFDRAHVDWLQAQRRPGCWAVLPRLGPEGVEPFGAVYEPMLLPVLERAASRGIRAVHQVVLDAPVVHPELPTDLADGWRNGARADR
jgi:molybdopterin-guanine dinucleotide biosynthesis protein MobB